MRKLQIQLDLQNGNVYLCIPQHVTFRLYIKFRNARKTRPTKLKCEVAENMTYKVETRKLQLPTENGGAVVYVNVILNGKRDTLHNPLTFS